MRYVLVFPEREKPERPWVFEKQSSTRLLRNDTQPRHMEKPHFFWNIGKRNFTAQSFTRPMQREKNTGTFNFCCVIIHH